jgi:Mg2+/Co2+ transporter CorB
MHPINVHWVSLFGSVVLLVLLSAFFSGSETSMMSVNRYRLRHLAREGSRPARRILKLLERPDRLLGIILIGNTFANIVASSLATLLAVRLFGDLGIVIAAITLTLFILIFAEMAPKTLAALYPQQFAFAVSFPLLLLLNVLYPVVWFANLIANNFLRLLGVKVASKHHLEKFNVDELRTIVQESVKVDQSIKHTQQRQDMLLGILDLVKFTVADAMIPKKEIIGIDLNESLDAIIKKITSSQFSRFPIYYENLDGVFGIFHTRNALRLLSKGKLSKRNIIKYSKKPYFIPEKIPLSMQLHHFRKKNLRSSLVVNEYGDIVGLITLEDILEEIVGELDSDIAEVQRFVAPQKDGGFLVDGVVLVRELNKSMGWSLPTDGPKTLSGLIIEQLETIPSSSVSLKVNDFIIEVVEMDGNTILKAKITPPMH